MKKIFVLIYWIISWLIKYVINLCQFIWHFDFKHFTFYDTYFFRINDYKKIENSLGLNWIERFIYNCIKNN